VARRLSGEVLVPIEAIVSALRAEVPVVAESSSPDHWRVRARFGGRREGDGRGWRLWLIGTLDQTASSTTQIQLEVYPSGQFTRAPIRWTVVAIVGWCAVASLWVASVGAVALVSFLAVPIIAFVGGLWIILTTTSSSRAVERISRAVGLPPQ
jgi:hypothetical protein